MRMSEVIEDSALGEDWRSEISGSGDGCWLLAAVVIVVVVVVLVVHVERGITKVEE